MINQIFFLACTIFVIHSSSAVELQKNLDKQKQAKLFLFIAYATADKRTTLPPGLRNRKLLRTRDQEGHIRKSNFRNESEGLSAIKWAIKAGAPLELIEHIRTCAR